MQRLHLTASEAAEKLRQKSLIWQEFANSAGASGEEWRWYYHAFMKLAATLEKDRQRFLAIDPETVVEVPVFVGK